ncbi:BN6_48550 family protein [Frankia sp. AiPs1]|uniref:CATRA conflict system CASPASE/TPR repeat-associated protein n=1 Tax=Frankia sp. AiPs1 TaxID=573493 RepID=UPI0020432003|nr:CATRA conflict system CASPASE/TPR repeat-associated protein [Frankia sp. AiPs1]MCM3920238.1 BN6_48550 family protein [Frankia sp. AiPs1]
MTGPRAPALLTYLWLRPDATDGGTGWQQTARLWRWIRRDLRLTAAIAGLHVPVDLPAHLPSDASALVAAAGGDRPGVWQALARVEHDLLCISVMQAPADQPELHWPELEATWLSILHPPHGAGSVDGITVGEARLFLGLSPPGCPDDERGSLVQAALRPPTPLAWRRQVTELDSRICLWEITVAASDDRSLRRFVVLGPQDHEVRVDQLVWTATGDGDLTPLARFLLHAAKLRHQLRVFAGGRQLRQFREDVDRRIDWILDGDGDGDGPGDGGDDRAGDHHGVRATDAAGPARPGDALRDGPVDGGRDSARLHKDLVIAATTLSRLRRMRQSIEIIHGNMRRNLARAGLLGAEREPDGPIGDDLNLAQWFRQRLDDEVAGLTELTGRATDVDKVRGWLAMRRPAAAADPALTPEPGPDDLVLTREQHHRFCNELARVFGSGTPGAQLLDEIGLARSGQINPIGLSPWAWWTETFRELDHGIIVAPYRQLLAGALRRYPDNTLFTELARHC